MAGDPIASAVLVRFVHAYDTVLAAIDSILAIGNIVQSPMATLERRLLTNGTGKPNEDDVSIGSSTGYSSIRK